MTRIFVDTNAWIALNSKRDRFHSAAIALNKRLLQQACRYVTSNFVLDETYTGLLTKVRHVAAVDFGERIRQSRVVSVVHVSEQLEDDAWELFKRYSDKSFSFTDCTSFVIMKQFGLTDAFTNDRHFEQMDFAALLTDI